MGGHAPEQHLDRGGFTRPIGAEKAKNFALVEFKRDIPHDFIGYLFSKWPEAAGK